jgi:hypothetical protein
MVTACAGANDANSNAKPSEIELRVRIHSQNMTTAASAHADRKTLGHLLSTPE